MKPLHRLERRLSRLRVQPFYRTLVIAMAGISVLHWFFPTFALMGRLMLDASRVFRGEVWRLVTFLLLPPVGSAQTGIFQTALLLYLFYFVGTTLEGRWGPRRFLLFYLFGTAGAVAAGLLTGLGTNLYLNLSLFFAFAIQYPDFQVLLFFVLPVKVKWLAALNGLYYLYQMINNGCPERAAILLSLLNLALFFGGDLLSQARVGLAQWKRRQMFRRNSR